MLCVAVQILPHFAFAEEKNRLLRAVAGSGADSLSSLRAKWDKLELVVESHQLMIKEQVGWKKLATRRSTLPPSGSDSPSHSFFPSLKLSTLHEDTKHISCIGKQRQTKTLNVLLIKCDYFEELKYKMRFSYFPLLLFHYSLKIVNNWTSLGNILYLNV